MIVVDQPRMMSGYAFELDPTAAPLPSVSQDEDWETVVYKPDGREVLVGTMRIDDAVCRVFRCADGKYRAQLKVCTG